MIRSPRHPRLLVVSGFWVRDYLERTIAEPSNGRATQKVRQSSFNETGARNYFRALFEHKLPYRLAHESKYAPGFWPSVDGYESLAQTVFIFERVPVQAALARDGTKRAKADLPRTAR